MRPSCPMLPFLALLIPVATSTSACGPEDCVEPAIANTRAIFSVPMAPPYEVQFEAMGHAVERVVQPSGLAVVDETEPVSTTFRAECRDGQLHDVEQPDTTHGDCDEVGFAVPLVTIATVTLIRDEQEWTDRRGTAWVSNNDEQGCRAQFRGELWLETETLIE